MEHSDELMMAGKRILNLDEASLGQSNFLRSGWGMSNNTLRYITKPLGQRLSIFIDVDTFGKGYFAVSQANTDGRTFGGFLFRLTL